MKIKSIVTLYGLFRYRFFWLPLLTYFSCDNKEEHENIEIYNGPIRTLINTKTLVTDSGMALMNISSPKRLDYENNDSVWPKGFFLKIFDRKGELNSTFKADCVLYDNKLDRYTGIGNVIVVNIHSQDQLDTEELHWDPNKQEFQTDKFVTITSEGEVHSGTGMTSHQSISYYTIHNPRGNMKKLE